MGAQLADVQLLIVSGALAGGEALGHIAQFIRVSR
jgi:hypothetical protein